MGPEKAAIPLTTPKAGINVRYCRPEDVEAVRQLFRLCILHGAGSPARVALSVRMKTYPMICAYVLYIVFSLGFHFLSGAASILSLFCMVTDVVYICGSAYASIGLYTNFVSQSLKDDLEDPVGHYQLVLEKSDGSSSARDYVPSTVKAFWVAESVCSTTGKTEIVGAVGLDSSSHHKVAGTGEVRRIVVSPYHRRLGIAAALMNACESRAKACGLSNMVLTTSQYQPGAINMYERAGYRVYNRRAFPSGWGTIDLIDYGKGLA